MPSSWLVGLVAAALPTVLANTHPLEARHEALIRFPVVAQTEAVNNNTNSRRQIGVGSTNQQRTYYTIPLRFGTPGQDVPVRIDTGSSELWANPRCSTSANPSLCQTQPRFTYSTTLVDLGVTGHVSYNGGGSADFVYVADYVGVGSARITQQIFGAGYVSQTETFPRLGLAPSLGGWTSGYPLLLDNLATQGFINSRAFSLDLRGYESAEGSVIFGGVDTSKYEGSLGKLPIIPAAQSPDGFTRYWIRCDGISVTQADGTVQDVYTAPVAGAGQAFHIDSSSPLSVFPTAIFNQLVAAFPSAQYIPTTNKHMVDCLDTGLGGSIQFTFGDKTIRVPYSEFIYSENGVCFLGAKEGTLPTLGDSFLRAAYVVLDWDNRNVHLAQAANCGSSLAAIGRGADAVPTVVGCPDPVTTSSFVPSASASASSVASSEPASISATTSSEPASVSTTASSVASSVAPSSAAPISAASSSVASSIPPSSSAPWPFASRTTFTVTLTTTSTIKSCAPTVTNCHVGAVVTKIITAQTTICPATVGTYAIPRTFICSGADTGRGCPSAGATRTALVPITVVPPQPGSPKVVPGCTEGAPLPTLATGAEPAAAPGGGPTTVAPGAGRGGNGTAVSKPPPVLAGAGAVGASVVAVVFGVVMGLMNL
ncbi:aspartic peptidase domain-containing protein [Podospora conica]|nr:aspartic peptidase domain-containing protein [Schizothecium conicum]